MNMTTDQAVTFLRVKHGYTTTKKTLETLRSRGNGSKYNKIGRRVYYSPTQLEEWLHNMTEVRSNTGSQKLC